MSWWSKKKEVEEELEEEEEEEVLEFSRFRDCVFEVVDVFDDILLHIFSFLPQKQLPSIALVCQLWHELVREPILWPRINVSETLVKNEFKKVDIKPLLELHPRELGFKKVHYLVDDKTIEQLSPFSALTSLNLTDCFRVTDGSIETLSTFSMELLNLNLMGCVKVSDSGVSHIAKMTDLLHLGLHGCIQISDLTIHPLTNLRSLDVTFCDKINDTALRNLSGMKDLRSISLSGCEKITSDGILELPLSLRTLDLSGCSEITNETLQIFTKFRKIHTLSLKNCWQVSDSGMESVAQLIQLRSLNIGGCMMLSDEGMGHLADLQHMTSLDVNACEAVGDRSIKKLKSVPKLRRLDSRNTMVSLTLLTGLFFDSDKVSLPALPEDDDK